MKIFRRSLFAMASVMMLAACSSDDFNVDDPNEIVGPTTGDGVYMGLTIKMPSSAYGRSSTVDPGQSTDGNEEGQDYENNVDNVIIVIADPTTNAYVTSGTVASNKLTPVPGQNAYKSVAKIELSELSQYYSTSTSPTINQQRTVNVWVICNPSLEQQKTISEADFGDTNWINSAINVSEEATEIASKAGKGGFVMTNATKALRQLPNTVADWNYYKTEASAFDLSGINQAGQDVEVDNSAENIGNPRGSVRVDRMAARFDFKDGSLNGNNTYDVVKNTEGKTLIQIKLEKMALVNLSNKMYSFRRVSDNGLPNGNNFSICGNETPSNYIVGPYAQTFATATSNNFGMTSNGVYSFKFEDYFWQPFFTETGRMDYNKWSHFLLIDDILKGTSDNYGNKEYTIWHYAAENVIPGPTSRQQNGLSTGVVFKGKMVGTEELEKSNKDLYDALNGIGIAGNSSIDPILYSFNGSLYFTWDEMRKAAIEASVEMENDMPVLTDGKISVNRSNSLYIAVFGNGGMPEFTWGTTKYQDPDDMPVDTNSPDYKWSIWYNAVQSNTGINTALANMRQAMTSAGITLYQSSTDSVTGEKGYFCFYYYWNRHNDNQDLGVTLPMEFSVVRNNVYKLAVTNINQLGHPRLPENDPDGPTPDTPDESTDIYINVTCEVLPWVVRINNIEF